MILTLEVTGPEAGKLGPAQRKVFSASGGTIGRQPDNAWVLNDPYVSGHHAVIRYLNGQFSIEDTSTNGTFINSTDRRLRHGEPYALKSGDRVIIDPFDIRASITGTPAEDIARPAPSRPAVVAADPFDPFDDRPRDPTPSSAHIGLPFRQHQNLLPDPVSDPNLDPMAALFDDRKRSAPKEVPRPPSLASGSPMHEHYEPPRVILPPDLDSPPSQGGVIPDDWDKSQIIGPHPVPPPRPSPPRPALEPEPPASVQPARPRRTPAPVVTRPPAPVAPVNVSPPSVGGGDVTLASVLAQLGFPSVAVTPELAQSFADILHVVVSGVMDILRARQQIKEEFRIRGTIFKPANNNPLKFSANVEDALHNLLVKRNAAYLGPVEAFEDAFDDLRNHQMAMLAGVRVAFEAMLADLDPDRLQEEFDRQLKKGGGLVPAKLRYWELYRDKVRDMVKDPDTNFREWFGEEFAAAYEEQLKRLRAQSRGGSR